MFSLVQLHPFSNSFSRDEFPSPEQIEKGVKVLAETLTQLAA
jgi:hypothetical protein